MKIAFIGGKLTATAENVEDAKTIVSLAWKKDEGVAERAVTRKVAGIKYPCPVYGCGKKVSKLAAHVKRNHPEMWERRTPGQYTKP